MPSSPLDRTAPAVTGIGIATGFGYGKNCFVEGLFSGRNLFAPLVRAGRQPAHGEARFIGIEVPEPPEVLTRRIARTAGLSARVSVAVVAEAWAEAGLEEVDPTRIGLVLGGSNLQSRELMLAQQDAETRGRLVSPHLGYAFFDTDIAGLCAERFGIRGRTLSIGAASASGAAAVIQAAELVASGHVDACIAVGALQDLSAFELAALSLMGALGPGDRCRPFDRAHDGFMFGESAAALVIRRGDAVPRGGGYGCLAGWSHISDGRRGPEPSLEGELRAIQSALQAAGLEPGEIDYINAHGTGTPLGDDTEAAACCAAGLTHAPVNATKSIIGHGLASAGAVEVVAALLQMRVGRLHPTHGLENPIDAGLRWVQRDPLDATVRNALSLSFGFGGVNTAIVLSAPETA